MGKKALVPSRTYKLERIKPNRLGYYETVIYQGSLRQKPKGWRVIREV